MAFFFAYLYNLSPANRISFMLLTFNLLVQILFCTAFTNNTKQHGRHWRPLESGLNIPSLWWILPCNNTDAFSCSDTASWLRRSSCEEAATTVASNDNMYGIEQNCVYGPLSWPEKSQWLKRITPSVSTETCDVSQPMKVLSDTCLVSDLLGVATTVCVVVWQPACLLKIYRLSNSLFFARLQTWKLLLPAFLKSMVCRSRKTTTDPCSVLQQNSWCRKVHFMQATGSTGAWRLLISTYRACPYDYEIIEGSKDRPYK